MWKIVTNHLAAIEEDRFVAQPEEELPLGGEVDRTVGSREDGLQIGGEEAVPDSVGGGGGTEGGGDGGGAAGVAGRREGDDMGDAALGKRLDSPLTE